MSHQARTFPGCATFGTEHGTCRRAWLGRPWLQPARKERNQIVVPQLDVTLCRRGSVAWQDRPWWRPVAWIGEAKNPGPLVCTCNSGVWSRAEGLLSMGHDIILLQQETFLLQAKISRMASENGYFSSFVPARGTAGRPSGGLAILCKQAVPQGGWAVGPLYPALRGRPARL
eukprot:4364633-Amphidinium_carterae.1